MFLSDLRFALRVWRKRPMLAAAAVLTLALGTGANTAIFSVIHSVLLRPLPYPHADRLFQIWSADVDARGNLDPASRNTVNQAVIDQWHSATTGWEHLAFYRSWNVTGIVGGQPERLYAAAVSSDFLATLGAAPSVGRDFLVEENTPGNDGVVILSDRLRHSLFPDDPSPLGKTIRLDGEPRAVIGVMDAGFRCYAASLREEPDLYIPISTVYSGSLRLQSANVVGLLKPGARGPAARIPLDAISRNLGSQAVHRGPLQGVNLAPLQEEVFRKIRPTLLILFGATGCVLLIACANLANLTMAHIAARKKELVIRTALGASRARVMRQVLSESTTLAVAGCALGLLFSHQLVRVLVHLYPGTLPRLDGSPGSPVVLLFSILLAVLTGVLAGLVPAWRFSRADPQQGLKEGGALSNRSRRGPMFRAALIAAQVAVTFVLLIGAGLLLRSFLLLRAVDPGYRTQRLLTAEVVLPEKTYPQKEQQAAFAGRFLERVQAIPGVESAALTNSLPLRYSFLLSVDFSIQGSPEQLVYCRTVTPDYFRTMGISLVAGRSFEPSDSTRGVAIVNEAFARKFVDGQNPVGRVLHFGQSQATIIGLAPDVKNRDLDARSDEEIYLPYLQKPNLFMDIVVRSRSDPAALIGPLRAELRAIDPNQPLNRILTIEKILEDGVAPRRFEAMLLGTLASLAFILALVGIYGVISYAVSLGTREIGIRMALGAQRPEVLRWVLIRGIAPVLIGLALGVPASLAATRSLESWLYGIHAVDALTYVAIGAVMLLVSIAAAYVPARRATTIDPLTALRYE
ncbi:MAG TPA: ABC transporter permease [Verrucomicrobiae bacterium]|nr:ABC transporter permease [Verrucomicrobiae bacterium]